MVPPDEVANMFCIQVMSDWLDHDQGIEPLNMPLIQVRVNTSMKRAPFAWALHVTLLLQNWAIEEDLSEYLSHFLLIGLTHAKKLE